MEKVGKAQDQVAMPSQAEVRTDTSTKHGETTINDISDRNQEARFGFTNIGSSGSVSIKTVYIIYIPFSDPKFQILINI